MNPHVFQMIILTLKLPQSLSGIDRVEVNYQMKELIHRQKDAQIFKQDFLGVGVNS